MGGSSVAPETARVSGREKTGTEAGGKLDEGDGAFAERVVAGALLSCLTTVGSLIVLSVKASISSVEDCVGLGRGLEAMKGSGEPCAECAVARDPGPDDWEEELEPFLDDLVERAPPRKREARIKVGESPGNQGFRQPHSLVKIILYTRGKQLFYCPGIQGKACVA